MGHIVRMLLISALHITDEVFSEKNEKAYRKTLFWKRAPTAPKTIVHTCRHAFDTCTSNQACACILASADANKCLAYMWLDIRELWHAFCLSHVTSFCVMLCYGISAHHSIASIHADKPQQVQRQVRNHSGTTFACDAENQLYFHGRTTQQQPEISIPGHTDGHAAVSRLKL